MALSLAPVAKLRRSVPGLGDAHHADGRAVHVVGDIDHAELQPANFAADVDDADLLPFTSFATLTSALCTPRTLPPAMLVMPENCAPVRLGRDPDNARTLETAHREAWFAIERNAPRVAWIRRALYRPSMRPWRSSALRRRFRRACRAAPTSKYVWMSGFPMLVARDRKTPGSPGKTERRGEPRSSPTLLAGQGAGSVGRLFCGLLGRLQCATTRRSFGRARNWPQKRARCGEPAESSGATTLRETTAPRASVQVTVSVFVGRSKCTLSEPRSAVLLTLAGDVVEPSSVSMALRTKEASAQESISKSTTMGRGSRANAVAVLCQMAARRQGRCGVE